jgi:hypothetical protein
VTDLPDFPRNREQTYLAAIVERLDQQNELLAAVRDRLPEGGGPAPAVRGSDQQGQVELTEPAAPAGAGEAAPLPEPEAPKKRTPAKNAPAKKPAPRTGSGRGRPVQSKREI